jgi:FdhE protein
MDQLSARLADLWERRIERAANLEGEIPAAAGLLRFYRVIAQFQQEIAGKNLPPGPFSVHPAQIPKVLHHYPARLLLVLERHAPPQLASAARGMFGTDDWDPADPAPRFVARAVVQPYAESCARRAHSVPESRTPDCPFCGERPVCSVLRPEGEGGRRSLVCSLCFTEWEFNRVRCPVCAGEDKDRLPVYTAEQFPHIRIEACDNCNTYVKCIDLTRNGLAVPEVDEIAAVALDVWAAGKGYAKLQPNLLGL